jgi:hypothetical protein
MLEKLRVPLRNTDKVGKLLALASAHVIVVACAFAPGLVGGTAASTGSTGTTGSSVESPGYM